MSGNIGSLFVILNSLTFALSLPTDANFGIFWQLTDVHYDSNYTQSPSAQFMCHADRENMKYNTSDGRTHGEYGDYNCDSPWKLVVSALKAMKMSEEPDFILWTGDSVPHVSDSELNAKAVYTLVKNVTDELLAVFPKSPVYPSLGNHDIWPADQYPPKPAQYYQDILSLCNWDHLIGSTEGNQFKDGGFYTTLTKHGLRLVSLNSNLWYDRNRQIVNNTDPAGQFAWLEQVLAQASQKNEKVLISGHVPPGTMARADKMRWYYPTFNRRFLALLQKYSSIIHTTIFGHEHTDSFRVVYDQTGEPVVSMFLAPAVTPWKSTIPGIGANNPGLRLYTYERSSGAILDYTQYYLNLSAANQKHSTDWKVEYTAKKAYGMKDVGAKSLHGLVTKFIDESSDLFKKYYLFNSVSYDNVSHCTGKCKLAHICAVSVIDYEDFHRCVAGVSSKQHMDVTSGKNDTASLWRNHRHHHKTKKVPKFMFFVIGALVAVIVIMFVILALVCCKRRHMVTYLRQPRYVLLQADE